MNLRIDKAVRSVGLGVRKVYSWVLVDAGLYIIYTGSVGALKHYRLDTALNQVVSDGVADRSVKQLQAGEAQIDSTSLDNLLKTSDNYLVRLEAIEEVEIRSGRSPVMVVHVTGSDHHFVFPFAPLEQVKTLQRALSQWTGKKEPDKPG